MTIIIGDIHGCIKTLEALLNEIELRWPGEPLRFTGDFVDRGPDTKAVLNLILAHPEWEATAGNHDKIFVAVARGRNNGLGDFLKLGGDATLKSYRCNDDDAQVDIDAEHIEWLSSLPLFREYPTVKNAEGNYLRIQHAALASWFESIENACINAEQREDSILWYRGWCQDVPGIYQVYGHTSFKEPFIQNHAAGIDTGCAYAPKHPEYLLGLTAFRFETKEYYTQRYVD